MASNIVDAQAVEVSSTINFHEVINALEMFSEKYPPERISVHTIERIRQAANNLEESLLAYKEANAKTGN